MRMMDNDFLWMLWRRTKDKRFGLVSEELEEVLESGSRALMIFWFACDFKKQLSR